MKTENEKLLEFLQTSYNEYRADVLPFYAVNEDLADGTKTEFLDSLWDVITQHFDDTLSDEHDPEICGCEYMGNNSWNCGHIDNLPVEGPITYGPNHCPKCGSNNVDYRTFEWFDASVEYPADCLDCKAEFTEIYTYSETK